QPSRQPKSQPKSRPSTQPKSSPSTRPSRQPSTRPSSQPRSRPQPKPQPKPSTRPSTQPKSNPAPSRTQPAQTRPSRTQPSRVTPDRTRTTPSRGTVDPNRTRTTPSPRVEPRTEPRGVDRPSVRPDGDPVRPISTGTGNGTVKRVMSGGRATPRATKKGAPRGFDLDTARDSFARRMGGGMSGVGGRMGSHPDEPGGHGGGHGDGHGGGHDDGHHGGGHDDGHHGDDWHIDIDINFWSHPTYCPGGWWYVWGDYDGDGYLDYVCTNGSYSVYWYGWTGSYWDCSPWYGWYPTRYRTYWWTHSIPDTYRGTVYGTDDELLDEPTVTLVDDMPETIPEAVPLSAVEVARLEMSIGNPGVAIEAYRAHLSTYPDDWYTLRELGIAMIRDGQRGDGIAMIGYAHSQDPLLAYDAIPVELFEGDGRLMRDVLVKVVGWAHRNPSASAWLTVALIMQGEGRTGPAMKMIDRAEEHGLGFEVADQMRSALLQP
ncbi:MAG: hypothetical protein NXI07_10430, partial [bacterium]|nr:hypothetical protein [bacterium]